MHGHGRYQASGGLSEVTGYKPQQKTGQDDIKKYDARHDIEQAQMPQREHYGADHYRQADENFTKGETVFLQGFHQPVQKTAIENFLAGTGDYPDRYNHSPEALRTHLVRVCRRSPGHAHHEHHQHQHPQLNRDAYQNRPAQGFQSGSLEAELGEISPTEYQYQEQRNNKKSNLGNVAAVNASIIDDIFYETNFRDDIQAQKIYSRPRQYDQR